jgi:hypothetical protein
MRSTFLEFSFGIALISLAAWGIASCGGGDDQLFGAASTGTASTGAGGSGGNGTGGQSGTAGGGTGGSTSGTGGSTAASGTGGGSACADTWVITYGLAGQFSITDTPFGAGNTMQPIGPGTATIRFQDNAGMTAPGSAQLLSYHMTMMFQVSSQGLVVTTNVEANSGPSECGVARGTLNGMNLVWDTCAYDPMTWTTQAAGMGPGCVQAYHTTGNVNCNDMSPFATCMTGGLMNGDNPQDTTWDQPLNTFVFSADLSTFQMRSLDGPMPPMGASGVEIPNNSPGRTWISLDGTEQARMLQPTPACACPP